MLRQCMCFSHNWACSGDTNDADNHNHTIVHFYVPYCTSEHLQVTGKTHNKFLSAAHADKGKKSRFRQLTDLVKTGMSAATSKVNSRANSRAPSRGVTQDLEGFETTSKQITTKAAIEPVSKSQAPQAAGHKGKTSTALTEAQPRESANDVAFSKPVAEGHAHSSQAKSMDVDTLSEFTEILAAQPSRSASSAALLSHCQQAQQTCQFNTAQTKVIVRHFRDARPIAEGTETGQPVRTSSAISPKPTPKLGAGFLSGASTGRGATVQAPAAEAATASAARAHSTEQEPESGLLHGESPDDDLSLQRYFVQPVTASSCFSCR